MSDYLFDYLLITKSKKTLENQGFLQTADGNSSSLFISKKDPGYPFAGQRLRLLSVYFHPTLYKLRINSMFDVLSPRILSTSHSRNMQWKQSGYLHPSVTSINSRSFSYSCFSLSPSYTNHFPHTCIAFLICPLRYPPNVFLSLSFQHHYRILLV